MKIIHLTPGTGNFHCGSCLRDNHLVKALRRQGHDVVMVPLYLPLVTDDEPANPELPVFAGGINLYLQQKLPFLKFLPRRLFALLDKPRLLLAAAAKASMTSPRELGEMTLESLRGADGRQGAEWRRLIEWMSREEEKPDLVSLSNGLLNGLAPAIRRELGVPVVCSLQGEDSFLDSLPESYAKKAWDLFRANSEHVARYVATSDWYAGVMRRRLELPDERVTRVYNGMDFTGFMPAPPPPKPVIGFLARLIKGKGLETLVEAFVKLAPRLPEARLALAGTCTAADEPFIAQLNKRLAAAGLADRVEWRKNLDFAGKVKHLQSLTVLSVPATYGEAFGLYVLEALACRVPVVEPDHAGLGELTRVTGGGLLCEPDNPAALAAALERVICEPALRERLAAQGRETVLRDFTADRMASDFAAVCEEVLSSAGAEVAAAAG